jgi:hypothetical protein
MNLKKVTAYSVSGFLVAAVGWFSALSYSTGSQLRNYLVELKPVDNGVLEVKHENKCGSKGHKGCLVFEEDKVGLIKFYLPGFKYKVRNCKNTDTVITKIELTTTPMEGQELEDKGVFDGDLPDWIKDKAFPDVNTETGVVYEASLDDALTQVWLINMNSHDFDDGLKRFWYKVTATACEDDDGDGVHETWVTDPRGENEGTKY